MNKEIKVGDQVYLDTRAGATTQVQRDQGARTSKLDYPVSGPFPVIGCRGHTYEIVIDGVPELVSSDRIRVAPRIATPAPASLDDEEDTTAAEVANDATQRGERDLEAARKVNPESGYGTREFMIDRLMAEGIDDAGEAVFRVRWKGYSPRDDTWEPVDSLPAPIVARFRKDLKRTASSAAGRDTEPDRATTRDRRGPPPKKRTPEATSVTKPRRTPPSRSSSRLADKRTRHRLPRN